MGITMQWSKEMWQKDRMIHKKLKIEQWEPHWDEHRKSKQSCYKPCGSHEFCHFNQLIFIRLSLRRDILWYTNVRLFVCPFHISRSNLRTPWPIHFKFHSVIGIDSLMVCILFGEMSNFHSRVMGLYSSNCRRFFVCNAVNWEPLGQFTSSFA